MLVFWTKDGNASICFYSLEKGGIPPKFVIIDDGWQSVAMDATGTASKVQDAAKWVFLLLLDIWMCVIMHVLPVSYVLPVG